MRKLVLILTALAFVLGLAACGEKVPDAPEIPDTPNTPDTPDVPDKPDTPDTPDIPDTPDKPEEPEVPHFTREEFPRLDGSTATAPLAVAMTALMLGESEEDVEELISFSRTTNSYYNLLNGSADILIASEGNEEVYAYRKSLGYEWEQTPFAIDAFVFVVNEANPVESLTVDQIRKIYTGEITNWKELGGADEAIIALQRNPEAGSQSLMEKLVMQGAPMMEAPTEYVATSMGGLMEAVRGYDASAGAIGYSVYYYAEEMRAAEGLKLLKIEGVEPEPDAIRSGDYPLTNPYYVVIPASAPEGSPVRVIRDWLLSEAGQKLTADEGYVSVMDIPTVPRETLPVVGSRLFEEYTDTLVPGDYGALMPYAGLRLTDSEFAVTGCLYGLMTPAGQVVVDPVYSDVWFCGGLLVLTRVTDGEERVAVAAKTGEWCTDFEYLGASGGDEGVILYKEDSIVLMRRDGTSADTYSAEELGITPDQLTAMRLGPIEGGGGEWIGDKISILYAFNEEFDVLYFDFMDGTLKRTDYDTWASFWPPLEAETPVIEDAWFIYDAALGEDAPAILGYSDLGGETGVTTFYYEDGTPIPGLRLTGYSPSQSVNLINGLIEYLDTNLAEYYDLDTMEVVFRTYLGYGGD